MTRNLLALIATLSLLTPSLAAPTPQTAPTAPSYPVLDPLAGDPTDTYHQRMNKTLSLLRSENEASGNHQPVSDVDQIWQFELDKEEMFKDLKFNVSTFGEPRNRTASGLGKRAPLPLLGKARGPNGEMVPELVVKEFQTYTKFSAAAYCTPNQIRDWKCRTCPDNTLQDIQYFGSYWTMQGFVAVYPARQTILISFRGSINIPNWIANLKLAKTDADFLVSGAKVHSGMLGIYEDVKADVQRLVLAALEKNPGYSLTYSGHSLGAAIGLLASLDAHKTYASHIPVTDVYTFTVGLPRVGNTVFSQFAYDSGIGIFRGVNDNDLVPHLPLVDWGFAHVDFENWINPQGQVVWCDDEDHGGESKGCSNKYGWIWQLNVFNHLVYYGLPVSPLAC
ncbi:hypothetical protein HK104_002454 [Borealophlyctis nickersoniae]|nr:hypothetical protein HK104_002454 [Borealophlyctis nickersoniae]